MSVIVKGMGMPKNCAFCHLSHWNKIDELTGCELHQKHIPKSDKEFWEKDRPDWCPLIEVPDGHGRLIDANALFEEIYKAWDITADASDCNVLMQLINDAPTIIPADKEKT